MEIRDIATLHPNPLNEKLRSITHQAKSDLGEDVALGQISTFLIMPDGLILGGNNHYYDYLERGISQIKCIVVDFVQEGDEWFAIVDGEIQRTRAFKTKEEAMFTYAQAHNKYYATDNVEAVINYASSLNINVAEVHVQHIEPTTIGQLLDKEEKKEKFKKYFIKIKCENEDEQKKVAEQLTALNLSYKLSTK